MTVKLTSKAFHGTLLVMQSAYCRASVQSIDIYGYLLQISISADTNFHSALTKFLLDILNDFNEILLVLILLISSRESVGLFCALDQ